MKRTMRYLVCLCFVLSVCVVLQQRALAATPPPTTITVQQTPPSSTSPALIFTSIIGSSLPNFLELYNQSDEALYLGAFEIRVGIHDVNTAGCGDISATISLPSSWLLAKKYLTLERTSSPAPDSLSYPFALDPLFLSTCLSPQLASLALVRGSDDPEQLVAIPASSWSGVNLTVAQHKQRANSPNSTRTISGDFLTDYKIATGAITLNSDPLYEPPADNAGLQILEILPNARNCSPLDTDPTCNDYIKLYNPTDQSINLAAYRLRVGYKGQDESVANTFSWGMTLDPSQDELLVPARQYVMLTTRNDTQPLSLSDSGNYVWLEDAYGTTIYEPLVAYPDASSTTKVGYAWAFDGASWTWTSTPQPGGPNYFPPVPVVTTSSSTTSVSVLAPCDPGEYRNPDTNRCKSLVIAASASLTPCDPGEERNPATNRCRSTVTASAALTPCNPGWERNTDTNRCRKSTSAVAGAATTAIKDVAAPTGSSPTGWFVAAIAVSAALGYAVYEWRQDLAVATAKFKTRGKQLLPKISFRKRS